MSTNPTYVSLDSRSTPAMGSRFATDRLFKACMDHRYPHLIKFTKEASHNKVLFANGESSHVKEKLVIHVKNPKHPTGWITTSVDIWKKVGCQFFSLLNRWGNWEWILTMHQQNSLLVPLLDWRDIVFQLQQVTIRSLRWCFWHNVDTHKPSHSFAATSSTNCPAWNGKQI